MATTTYGSVGQRTAAWAANKMLEHAEPILVLSKYGDSKPAPKNKADTVKFRRPVPFAPATTPLTEGVTPVDHQMQYVDVSVQMQYFGDYVTITDKVMDMAEDPVLSDATMLNGEQAAETIETVTYGAIKAGTNVIYANGASRAAVNTAITRAKIDQVVRVLKKQRGKFIHTRLSGSTNYKTEPVGAAFVAFCHTDLDADIQKLNGFTPVELYGKAEQADEYEIGKCGNVRFITSPLLTPFANAGGAAGTTVLSTGGTSADVYPMIIVAKNSYGLVPLKGANSITPMVLNPGVPRGGDPLGQRGTVGWKSPFAACILNDTWMVRLECAASVL